MKKKKRPRIVYVRISWVRTNQVMCNLNLEYYFVTHLKIITLMILKIPGVIRLLCSISLNTSLNPQIFIFFWLASSLVTNEMILHFSGTGARNVILLSLFV